MQPAPDGRLAFTDEDKRIVANAEQFYDAWLETRRDLRDLPSSLYWNGDYLYEKRGGSARSLGRRSEATEAQYSTYQNRRAELEQRQQQIALRLDECLRQYRVLRLPQIMALPGRVLRELDLRGELGTDLIVVGTNAFAAYEIEARERFAHGLDETEDFDLGWCRGSTIGIAATTPLSGSPLLSALKAVDASFRMSRERRYQAVNDEGYQVELLAAPSAVGSMSPDDVFSPVPLPEQEWLLLGRAVHHVVCGRDGAPVPLVVPDPRYMGLHKLWLSTKDSRKATKRDKDARQGDLLLDAVARNMRSAYPLDLEFVLALPEELLPVFNAWAGRHAYVPPKTVTPDW